MTITQATSAKLRLITENDATEMLLDSYIMHRGRQRCLNCDCMESYSTLFEVWIHPTKTRTTGLTSLRLWTGPAAMKALPLAFLTLPVRSIPVCDDCIEAFEPHGEAPIPHASREAWADTLRRKYTPEPASRSESAKPSAPTLDML